jgi:hypothetical protein
LLCHDALDPEATTSRALLFVTCAALVFEEAGRFIVVYCCTNRFIVLYIAVCRYMHRADVKCVLDIQIFRHSNIKTLGYSDIHTVKHSHLDIQIFIHSNTQILRHSETQTHIVCSSNCADQDSSPQEAGSKLQDPEIPIC